MAKNDQYHPDYEAIYPGIEKCPEILKALKRSDRKMEYMEIDIKQENFIYNAEKRIARIQPSREDSYERLTEAQYQFSSNDKLPEDEVLQKIQYDELHKVLDQLTSEERHLITMRYWDGITQDKISKMLGISQQMISYKEKRILKKIKKLLEN